MRSIALVACLLASVLAGCTEPEPVSSEATLSTAASEARAHLKDPMFLGMLGIEGTIDLDRLESFLLEEADEEGMGDDARELFESFNLRVPQGDIGDGLPGSWFHAYSNQSWNPIVIIQVGSNGVLGSYVFDEAAYDDEYDDFEEADPQLRAMPWLADLLPEVSAAESTVYQCTTKTSVDRQVDSVRATQIARALAEFEEHVADHPDGEFIYAYVPTFEESCGDGDDYTWGNEWLVAHVDIDLLFDGIEPSVAYAVIDGSNGTLIDSGVEYPMEWRILVDETFEFTGEVLPSLGILDPAKGTATFDVPPGGQYFWLELEGDGDFTVYGPDGDALDDEYGGMYYWFEEAEPGTWTVEMTTHTYSPSAAFSFHVYADAYFIIED